MIGGKFQSKMRKVSAEENDLQKIEEQILGLAGRYPKTSR